MGVIEGALHRGEPLNPFGTRRFVPAGTSIQDAVDVAAPGDMIYIEPGEYDEAVTIPRTVSNIMLIGTGGRGAAFIAPSAANPKALTVHADDVTIVNLGCEGDGTGGGLVVTGARFRAYGSKFEGGARAASIGPGTDAQVTADTHGDAGDGLFEDCEFAWATDGLMLDATDYGAVTQLAVKGCRAHNCTNHINEAPTSAAVSFQNLTIDGWRSDDADDGTAPTAYILLNDDNANSGVVSRSVFPTAIDGGKNLVSTALHWVSNSHTGGVSTAQPS